MDALVAWALLRAAAAEAPSECADRAAVEGSPEVEADEVNSRSTCDLLERDTIDRRRAGGEADCLASLAHPAWTRLDPGTPKRTCTAPELAPAGSALASEAHSRVSGTSLARARGPHLLQVWVLALEAALPGVLAPDTFPQESASVRPLAVSSGSKGCRRPGAMLEVGGARNRRAGLPKPRPALLARAQFAHARSSAAAPPLAS